MRWIKGLGRTFLFSYVLFDTIFHVLVIGLINKSIYDLSNFLPRESNQATWYGASKLLASYLWNLNFGSRNLSLNWFLSDAMISLGLSHLRGHVYFMYILATIANVRDPIVVFPVDLTVDDSLSSLQETLGYFGSIDLFTSMTIIPICCLATEFQNLQVF